MNDYIGFSRDKSDAGHQWTLMAATKESSKPRSVIVHGDEYIFDGWLISYFHKRSGAVRFVIEDNNGRMFIHCADQIEMPDDDVETQHVIPTFALPTSEVDLTTNWKILYYTPEAVGISRFYGETGLLLTASMSRAEFKKMYPNTDPKVEL